MKCKRIKVKAIYWGFEEIYAKVKMRKEEEAKKFYKACSERNIVSFKDAEQQKLIKMLMNKYGYDSLAEAKLYYDIGMMQSYAEDYDYYNQKYETYIENSLLIGMNKYLDIEEAIKKAGQVRGEQVIAEMTRQIAKCNSEIIPIKTDPYFLGGLASGLAGPVAGMSVANDIQYQNMKAEFAREQARQDLKLAEQLCSSYGSYNKWESAITSVAEKIYDLENTDHYFAKLDYTIKEFKVINGFFIELRMEVEAEDVEINNVDFVLDGSLKINIYLEDEPIGNAYFIGKGKNCVSSLIYRTGYFDSGWTREVGFDRYYTYAFGKVNRNLTNVSKEKISFTVEPVYVWAVEKY